MTISELIMNGELQLNENGYRCKDGRVIIREHIGKDRTTIYQSTTKDENYHCLFSSVMDAYIGNIEDAVKVII